MKNNRRQTYRHSFNPQEELHAEIRLPGQADALVGELLDLSLGGTRVRMKMPAGAFRVGDAVVAHLLGRDAPEPIELSLTLPSSVVYLKRQGDDCICGVQFLPIVDANTRSSVERTLARFLLAEQRRRLQARYS
jgi:hypothetical protein